MKDKLQFIPYILIIILLIVSTFFYSRLDGKKREIESINAALKVGEILEGLDKKVNDIAKREEQTVKLNKSISDIDKKLEQLYNLERNIPKPNMGAIQNEVKNSNINDVVNFFRSSGYSIYTSSRR